MRALATILGLWRRRVILLSVGLFLALAAVAAGAGLLSLSGAALGAALAGSTLGIPAALRAFGGTRVVLRYIERLVTHDATFRVLTDLRLWLFAGLARGSAGGLGFRRAGDVLSRLIADIETLDGLYLRILLPFATAALLIPAILLPVFAGSALGGAALAACLAASLALPVLTASRAARRGVALAEAGAALRVAALDATSGLREWRAYGGEGRAGALVTRGESALMAVQRAIAGEGARLAALGFLATQAALLVILLAPGMPAVARLAAAFLLVAAFEPLGLLARAGLALGAARGAAARIVDLAEAPPPVPEPASPAPLPDKTGIRFDNVSFRWADAGPDVLSHLTLDIPAGAKVAILGASGAGKSTLAALLLKIAAPRSGTVTLGGVDYARLEAAGVRSRFAFLTQATHVFDDTLRANLLLGRPDAPEAALWQALDAAALGSFARSLPEGLETWLGEGGARLSGGQARRVALARALLSQAPILILDEPATGLDADAEREFLAALFAHAGERTVILIAHRLTGAERLDRIWRLSAGRAVAAAG